MISVPFDTLRVRQRLVSAGFSDEQADKAVAIMRESAADVRATKAKPREPEGGLKADLREFERRMTMRVGWMLVVWVAVLAAVRLASE